MGIANDDDHYHLRGHMVDYKSDLDVRLSAQIAASALGVTKTTVSRLDQFVEMLRRQYKIEVVFEYDKKWMWISDAACDPGIRTIALPESLFKNALKGKAQALFTFFHELGHILLGHKAVLHHNKSDYCKEVDSEYQADIFAKEILKIIGISLSEEDSKQKSLFD